MTVGARKRRAALGVLVALVAMLTGASPVAAQSDAELTLERIDASGFPLVRAVVSGPAVSGELDDAFTVVENGEPVGTTDVVRLRANDLNVVIALDVSGSMEGDALQQAKSAIATMLETLPAEVPVSIVSFGNSAVVQSAFTTDRGGTMASVEGLIAAGETALFDAVELSLAQLRTQGGTGALVVVADGDDRGSEATLDSALSELGTADVEASFVALETGSFSADTLRAMAEASGGQVVSVDDAAGFGGGLQEIAAALGNSYEVRWRSTSEGGTTEVGIALAGQPSNAVTTEFRHEGQGVFVPQVATDTRTVDAGLFAGSWIPLVAALFVSAGGVYLFLVMRNSESAVERREERLSDREARKEARRRRMSGMQEALEGLSAHMLEANDRGRSLDDTLDRAGLSIRANEFVVAVAALVLASLLVGVLLFGVPYFLLALIVPALGVPLALKILAARRKKAFVNQLADTLQLMAGSLKAGYGLGQTLDSVAKEAESPTKEEFSRVVMETRLGRSLEDALDAMSLRIQAPDFDWVVDAIKIQASVGGDLAEIIEQVGDTIRARNRIKRQVDALTAEGKISALVLFCLPFGLAGFIFTSNPTYIEPLYSSGAGYVMTGAALTMMLIGGLWLRKLVNPEF